jgi:beta-galactosidase GanA
MLMRVGVCYYPEHWPESTWEDDARRMKALGIEQVQIAEFAWSRIEPTPGVAMFFAMQKHFIAGLTFGATKG